MGIIFHMDSSIRYRILSYIQSRKLRHIGAQHSAARWIQRINSLRNDASCTFANSMDTELRHVEAITRGRRETE